MAKSTLMRVSNEQADKVKERAATHQRQQVTELDLIIDAGLAALEADETKGRKGSTRTAAKG